MAETRLIDIYLRPFHWMEADEEFKRLLHPATVEKSSIPKDVNVSNLVQFLSGDSREIQWFVERYQQISRNKNACTFAVPDHPELSERLYAPLLNAKRSYVVGNPLATIALAGFFAEMMALLIYSVHLQSSKDNQRFEIAHKDFEDLGQERRIERLKELKLIGGKEKGSFTKIRKIRGRYLHRLSQHFQRIDSDALEIYFACEHLLQEFLKVSISEGKLLINPAVLDYLEKI